MKKNLFNLVSFILFLGAFVVFTNHAFAASTPAVGNISFPPSKYTGSDLSTFVGALIDWIVGFSGLLGVIAIIYSGIMYMTAGGDQEKAAKARKNLTWAILGVIIVVLCWFIVSQVNSLLNGGTI